MFVAPISFLYLAFFFVVAKSSTVRTYKRPMYGKEVLLLLSHFLACVPHAFGEALTFGLVLTLHVTEWVVTSSMKKL